MGDENVGQVTLFLQIHHQVQDLCLNRYVQSGNRLIADDEGRVQDDGTADTDTLAASAVQLMGIGVSQSGSQTYGVHGLSDLLLDLFLAVAELVDLKRLRDQLLDGHTRVNG